MISHNNSSFGNRVSLFIMGWVAFGLLISYLNAVLSPSPLFSGNITRFNYMENSAMPWLKYLTSERFFYAFFLIGSLYSFFSISSYKFKSLAFFFYLALLVYLFLAGEKFTGPVLGSLVFFIFVFSAHSLIGWRRKDIIVFRRFIIFFCSLIFLYVLYSYVYKYELGQALGSPLLGLLYRGFVLQGHTQWGVDLLFAQGDLGGGSLWKEHNFSGMSIAMHAIAPPEVLQAFSQVNNASFSSAYPGVVLYSFGWFGVIVIQLFFAFTYFVFSSIFSWAISRRYILSSVLSMQCLFVFFYVYNMGNFNAFWSLKFLIASFGLFFIIFLRSFQSHGGFKNV
ncbi:DUF6418 domain-containing protein [Marinobacter sp. ST-43]|uniref:DUF6418 domain-containing protein n=1 Tax=Marinobacter sp. ST-43 TaxID=3050453 RepID=UPI0026DEEBC0|nr:DUF6418 domain-containing protein [Marinobacter sp. ST-43]